MIERLKNIITELNISQKDFAETIGITTSGLSDILNGRTKGVTITLAYAIQAIYNIDAHWLLSGKGGMHLLKTPLTGLSRDEKIATLEAKRRARFEEEKNIPLREAVEAMKKKPESIELVKLVLKIPAGKYQQLKTILKTFLG